MKIALIGFGSMGQTVSRQAEKQRHEIKLILDREGANLTPQELAEALTSARVDVAIDFSQAEAVVHNFSACLAAGIPLVQGTTGWSDQFGAVREMVLTRNGACVYGANFSISMNLFYRLVNQAAQAFAKFGEYETFIEEQHHSRKKDAPSGTALRLRGIIAEHIKQNFTITSTRAGSIPGTHRVGFDGAADQVLLEHSARSRTGFAAGAILAAEWIIKRKGFYDFSEVMDEILTGK